MNKTQKLVKLIDEMCSNCDVKAVRLNPDGSVANTIKIAWVITEDENNFGECIGELGEICMTIQTLEEDAKVVVCDEYIELSGSVSGVWRFYPDCDKSVFDLITEHE